MTVSELYEKLGELVEQGHGNTRVIGCCEFWYKGEFYSDFYLTKISDVYYQSGDIEIALSNKICSTKEKQGGK